MPRAGKRHRTRADAGRENGKKGGRPRIPRNLEIFKEMGPPPTDDPMKTIEWMFKGLAISAHSAATDDRLTDEKRRAELVRIGKAMGALIPKERLRIAEDEVKKDAAKLTTAVDPKMEKAPKERR